MLSTYYLDLEAGSDANNATSFALRKKTLASVMAIPPVAGDTIRIMGSPAPTSLGINATWTNLSPTVTLASSLTQMISDCESAWTASTNVTATTNATRKEGTLSANLAIAAGFTTGLAAYFATGTLDLSGYQQVSFWIRVTATIAAAKNLSLRLCTDTVGAVSAHTVTIPDLSGSALNQWTPITVNLAGNLNAAIKSVALYVDTDNGAVTIQLDNIIAVKASASPDSLSLTSLIGKPNSTGAGGTDAETWYAIRSINGTTVSLETNPNSSAATTSRGYSGTTETVTTWKRETIKTTMVAASGTVVQTVTVSGSAGNLLALEGGWDRTAMSSQNLETWCDGQNGLGTGLAYSIATYTSVNRVSLVRYTTGANITGANNTVSNLAGNCNGGNGIGWLGDSCTFNNVFCCNNLINGSGGASNHCNWTGTLTVNNNISAGLTVTAYGNTFSTIVASNNGTNGVSVSGAYNGFASVTASGNVSAGVDIATGVRNTLLAVVASGNGTFGVRFASGDSNTLSVTTSLNTSAGIGGTTSASYNYLINSTMSESPRAIAGSAFSNYKVFSRNDQGIAGAFHVYCDGGDIATDTSTVHTAGTSWKLSPASTNRSVTYPLDVSLARFACVSGRTYTVTCWVRRDDNATLVARLVCKGGQLSGIATDQIATASGAANAWEQLSISFTPTENGVIEVVGQAYGGTTLNAWFDDLAVGDGTTTVSVTMDYTSLWTGPGPDPLVSAGGGGGSTVIVLEDE